MSKKKTGVFKKKASPMRGKMPPPSQVHKKEKGAGSYDRKKDKKEDKETFDESAELGLFVDAILEKNYAEAYKYLSSVVDSKLQARIAQEVSTPLF